MASFSTSISSLVEAEPSREQRSGDRDKDSYDDDGNGRSSLSPQDEDAFDVDDDDFDWNSEDDREIANIPESCSNALVHAFDPREASSSGTKSFEKFTKMGFSERLVAKVLQEVGEEDDILIVEALLTYKELEASLEGQQLEEFLEKQHLEQMNEASPTEMRIEPNNSSTDNEEISWSDMSDDDDFSDNDMDVTSFCGENDTMAKLMHMGYTAFESSTAIGRCPNSSLAELTDFISAARIAKDTDELYPLEVNPRTERRLDREMLKQKKRKRESKRSVEDCDLIRPPHPMIGFGVPSEPYREIRRTLPKESVGPPYFYYENVALAPKGVWSTISRFLYEVEPEFVDSKYFCAAARKRGYVHNLPIKNRYPLLPLPALTVTEALPVTKKWWPSWDTRKKLNCLRTRVGSAKLTEWIRKAVEKYGDEKPPPSVQKDVMKACRRWNLVWVGRNKVAPLEADELEMLLGYPRNHTRGGGISRTDRYKSLGNSFQVDTVAYHFSVLRDKFPDGINVLSLFSGIGGAEVALHRLGIRLKNVVSVEISEANRNILRGWWDRTNQSGNLVELADVERVDADVLDELMNSFGGFDLVVGGSPCNNLSGSNRVHRDGLEGKESSLFYDFFRILDLVNTWYKNTR